MSISVTQWTMPQWLRAFAKYINTCGVPIEDLINGRDDFLDSTHQIRTLPLNNILKYSAVDQLALLEKLRGDGLLQVALPTEGMTIEELQAHYDYLIELQSDLSMQIVAAEQALADVARAT